MSMMSSWEGYVVSINCSEPLGCYQGTIKAADSQTITLTKAFRNGFPYPKPEVTLSAADIRDIQIINIPGEGSQREHSTVEVTRNKKSQRHTVCESLQATPSASSGQQSAKGQAKPTPSKPIEIQGATRSRHNSQSGAGAQPRARSDKARKRNEACFGGDDRYADDFDFEGNLALFDKRALWHEMRNAHRPDLVRQADDALRHDENVLGGGGAPGAGGIRVPDEARGAAHYASDVGVPVPSVSARVRRALWAALHAHGLSEAADTLLARAAADVCLRLAGGGRRLDARNAHQAPTAVALVGAHRGGARGLRALRLLASHGVRAWALLGAAPPPAALRRELAAARLAGVALAESAARLPRADVVVVALYDAQLDDAESPAHEAALEWARSARGVVVALEPPASGWAGVTARACVLGLLPPALSPSLGHVFLANVAPPPRLLQELGIDYRSPFGASSAISLCLTEDS